MPWRRHKIASHQRSLSRGANKNTIVTLLARPLARNNLLIASGERRRSCLEDRKRFFLHFLLLLSFAFFFFFFYHRPVCRKNVPTLKWEKHKRPREGATLNGRWTARTSTITRGKPTSRIPLCGGRDFSTKTQCRMRVLFWLPEKDENNFKRLFGIFLHHRGLCGSDHWHNVSDRCRPFICIYTTALHERWRNFGVAGCRTHRPN